MDGTTILRVAEPSPKATTVEPPAKAQQRGTVDLLPRPKVLRKSSEFVNWAEKKHDFNGI